MLPRLVLIHCTACNADSQRSESQFECVWDVFAGHIGAAVRPRRNVLVLAWWCKTVINVCSLSLLSSSPIFSPTLSPNCLLCSLPLSLHQSFHIFPYSLFPHSVSHLPLLYFFHPPLSLCPTGVRAGDDISILQVHPHHHGKSSPLLPRPRFCLLLLHSRLFLSPLLLLSCPFMSEQRC